MTWVLPKEEYGMIGNRIRLDAFSAIVIVIRNG
jgi:hypothetical protein